ncbi:nodulation S family protein [Rhodopseudomonas sp. HC1]|uniref:class I SAM-dependent methyltransferase n=1 Tax=Rhodopseudomonas infernalis TaxID=2897386 RepID=UPI001EE7F51E|nr:class I SAM-dependent methyltransferase [Rhodopseudomonas infernalis]MCG6205863.1 nodulation S family protein [Rhodopseudomonas infernalis]
MSRRTETIAADYFEQKYRADIDPWRFRSSDYEREKYQSTLAALGRPRFGSGLEVGCSIGVLTAQLAPRCDKLLAIDASQTAIDAARAGGVPANVTFDVATLPQQFPAGRFDLIVLSEVLYYFAAPDLAGVAQQCIDALRPDGEIILCHWLGETDYPLTGLEASDQFFQAVAARLPVRAIVKDEVYRLERLGAS